MVELMSCSIIQGMIIGGLVRMMVANFSGALQVTQSGFGHGINDGRPFWIGNFSKSDRAEVLFYYPGDDNWWLGSHDGANFSGALQVTQSGFGHGIDYGRPFWIGDFNGNGRA